MMRRDVKPANIIRSNRRSTLATSSTVNTHRSCGVGANDSAVRTAMSSTVQSGSLELTEGYLGKALRWLWSSKVVLPPLSSAELVLKSESVCPTPKADKLTAAKSSACQTYSTLDGNGENDKSSYKLIDLGAAAGWGESGAEDCMQTACEFAGTPAYSPPEAFRKSDADGTVAGGGGAGPFAWDQAKSISYMIDTC